MNDADGYGKPRAFFHGFADIVGNLFAVAEQPHRLRYVQPAFVQSETFHSVREFRVYSENLFAVFDVLVVVRRYEYDIRAFLPRNPYGFARCDAGFFGKHILCQNYPVPDLGIPAYGKRQPVEFGVHFLFHRCVEIVEVAMEYGSVHKHIIHK